MKTACTHCGQSYRMDNDTIGKKANCRKCGKAFRVAADSDSTNSSNSANSSRQTKRSLDTTSFSVVESRSQKRRNAARSPEEKLQKLLKGFEGEFPRPRVKFLHQLVAIIVVAVMLCLPVIYLSFIGAIGWLTWWHAMNDYVWFSVPGGRAKIIAGLAYLFLIVAGVLWVLSLVRPLFVRLSNQEGGDGLSREDEPVLFAFTEQLADLIGAPRPEVIFLSFDVNAYASYRTSWFGLKRNKFTLTLGVPLIAGTTLPQLTGIMAHEFGHFSQSGSTFLMRTINRINSWFAVAVYSEDMIDDFISELTHPEDNNATAAILGFMLWLLVGLGRCLLWLLMMLGHAVSSTLTRRMEYDADQYEIGVVGSETFISTSKQMIKLSLAYQFAGETVFGSRKGSHLPRDFSAYVAEICHLDKRVSKRAKRLVENEKSSWFASHPITRARMKAAEKADLPGIFSSELPATALFNNFPKRSRNLSKMLYQLTYGPDFDSTSTRTTDEAVDVYFSTVGKRRES